MEKKLSILVYLILIGVMAVTTFVEKYTDTRFVITHFYGSWWFSLIWALGTVCGAIYFLRARVKRISVILLHFSFLLILIGAMLTHFFSSQGEIDVRKGTASHSYFNSHNREHCSTPLMVAEHHEDHAKHQSL